MLSAFCLLLPSLVPRRSDSGKDSRVDALGITQHHEAKIAHVFLRHALYVGRCHSAKAIDVICRVAPAAADQFILRQLAGLSRVGLLSDVVFGEILLHRALDFIRVKRLSTALT